VWHFHRLLQCCIIHLTCLLVPHREGLSDWYWKELQTKLSIRYGKYADALKYGNEINTDGHIATFTDEALGVTILIVYAPAWDAETAADDNKIRFNSVFRQLIKLRAEVANKDAPRLHGMRPAHPLKTHKCKLGRPRSKMGRHRPEIEMLCDPS
jgi:hypothetical protein